MSSNRLLRVIGTILLLPAFFTLGAIVWLFDKFTEACDS